jgi:hypothetical protein
LTGDQTYKYPDGTVITARGEMLWTNGVKSELIPGAKGSGFQYYTADGKKLRPGEKVSLPDGQTVKQDRL